VEGQGIIDGQGAIWWDCFTRNVSNKLSKLLQIFPCHIICSC
jgi:hypothetical protein